MAKVSLRAYNREIETLTNGGQLDEAVAHCQHILKTFPKHLETYRLLGKVYLEYKRYKDAVDIFSRVLVSEPNDFVSNVGMSIIADEENKLDDAIWHMERAFETQPSNAAIQGELQRLYGRREGVQPPRIRMTRGALAHMYVQGELYPQAISEIKSVLKDDPGRSDMQVLLARACYKSGQKNEAVEEASAVLRRYPYCLDANRILVEILGSDRPENSQLYRQRVVELDPYAAQVTGTIFQSNEVSDAAVTLERLEWTGQPVGMQDDWESRQAISLESGRGRNEQPDWLKQSFSDSSPTQPPSKPTVAPAPVSIPSFDSRPQTLPPAQPTPADDLPDFLREAGWGQSTGSFDESKSMFSDEPAPAASSDALPIAQGDMPDWVKAMAPPQVTQPAEEEVLPDWINKIGTGALSSAAVASSSDQFDWLNDLGDKPSQPQTPADTESDWMKQFDQPASSQPVPSDQPDWLQGFGNKASETPAPSSTSANDFDFLNELTAQPQQPVSSATAPAIDTGNLGVSDQERDDSFAWLENLAAKQGASEGLLTKPEDRLEQEPDWVKQAKGMGTSAPSSMQQPPISQPPSQSVANVEELGKSQSEIDDSLAWLESLAAKQGATEGLLIKPEDRTEKEPDWVQQAKSAPPSMPSVSSPQPVANVEELGKSQSEIDDSLAWLEGLAAKQGATEGLLIKPEDRMEKEPDWVQQAKSAPQTPSAPIAQPVANVEELGKSEQERDDSFAWLENLAAKQGATEGLLTKPEERLEVEPEWVQQAKTAPQFDQAQPPAQTESFEQPSASVDETAAWLRSLDEDESKPAPVSEPVVDDTALWLKSLDEPEPEIAQPVQSDLPSWMQSIEQEETSIADSVVPEKAAAVESNWKSAIEEPVASSAPVSGDEDIPSWLKGVDEEAKQTASASQDDLPAWMRDATGEVVAEPTKIEPTRPTDWHPVEEKQPEPVPPAPQPVHEQPKPVPVQEKPKPFDQTQGKPAPVKKAAPKPAEVKPATPPAPYREPVTQRGTGMLAMPVDPVLGSARSELSRSNIPGALETYAKLIKKGRFLDEVIFDLRDALYRYPVEISIWQSLGDAYMRANRLQDALDAYTKAEELLR